MMQPHNLLQPYKINMTQLSTIIPHSLYFNFCDYINKTTLTHLTITTKNQWLVYDPIKSMDVEIKDGLLVSMFIRFYKESKKAQLFIGDKQKEDLHLLFHLPVNFYEVYHQLMNHYKLIMKEVKSKNLLTPKQYIKKHKIPGYVASKEYDINNEEDKYIKSLLDDYSIRYEYDSKKSAPFYNVWFEPSFLNHVDYFKYLRDNEVYVDYQLMNQSYVINNFFYKITQPELYLLNDLDYQFSDYATVHYDKIPDELIDTFEYFASNFVSYLNKNNKNKNLTFHLYRDVRDENEYIVDTLYDYDLIIENKEEYREPSYQQLKTLLTYYFKKHPKLSEFLVKNTHIAKLLEIKYEVDLETLLPSKEKDDMDEY